MPTATMLALWSHLMDIVFFGSFGLCPVMVLLSNGEGRYATTPSSNLCTPIYIRAEPTNTGCSLPLKVPSLIARLIISMSIGLSWT